MVTLIILDGFGLRKEKNGNAIYSAGTPNLDKLLKKLQTGDLYWSEFRRQKASPLYEDFFLLHALTLS